MGPSVSPRKGEEISASHLKLREGAAAVPYINPPFLLCCIVSDPPKTYSEALIEQREL